MRKMAKDNIIVVCTIALCVALTLVLCVSFSAGGLLSAFKSVRIEEQSVWAIVAGGYSDLSLARSSAALIKARGGAGYVTGGDSIEIVYCVYAAKDEANEALSRLGASGAYLKQIELAEADLKWCDDALKDSVENALSYYDICFECLKSSASSLADGSAELADVKTQIKVLYSQIVDIKSLFYQNTINCESEEITQIKLALITALALIDNVELDGARSQVISSLRYQQVQLVLCRSALMRSI